VPRDHPDEDEQDGHRLVARLVQAELHQQEEAPDPERDEGSGTAVDPDRPAQEQRHGQAFQTVEQRLVGDDRHEDRKRGHRAGQRRVGAQERQPEAARDGERHRWPGSGGTHGRGLDEDDPDRGQGDAGVDGDGGAAEHRPTSGRERCRTVGLRAQQPEQAAQLGHGPPAGVLHGRARRGVELPHGAPGVGEHAVDGRPHHAERLARQTGALLGHESLRPRRRIGTGQRRGLVPGCRGAALAVAHETAGGPDGADEDGDEQQGRSAEVVPDEADSRERDPRQGQPATVGPPPETEHRAEEGGQARRGLGGDPEEPAGELGGDDTRDRERGESTAPGERDAVEHHGRRDRGPVRREQHSGPADGGQREGELSLARSQLRHGGNVAPEVAPRRPPRVGPRVLRCGRRRGARRGTDSVRLGRRQRAAGRPRLTAAARSVLADWNRRTDLWHACLGWSGRSASSRCRP
jgi:hypothetical protein